MKRVVMGVGRILFGDFASSIPQSRGAGRHLMLLGGLICAMGVLAITGGVLSLRDIIRGGPGGPWLIFGDIAAILVGLLVIARGNFLLRASVRHFAETISSPAELGDGEFILYLRSFADDQRLAKPQPLPPLTRAVRVLLAVGRTEEEQLVRALSPAGPMVAVGSPGEPVPPVGAKRMYLPLDEWQEPVRQLMRRARFVVLALGPGAGTRWELIEAMRLLPPERLLLVVPMERDEYDRFRQAVADDPATDVVREETGKRWTPPSLPDFAEGSEVTSRIRGLIHFSADWEPHFLPLARYSLYYNSLFGSLNRELMTFGRHLNDYEQRTAGARA